MPRAGRSCGWAACIGGLVLSLGAVLGVEGCGPSLRMVHQNASYFERCHAADYNPAVSPSARSACWTRWLAYYRDGQPSDRIRFARARLAALENGKPSDPLPGMQGSSLDAAYTGSSVGSGSETEPGAAGSAATASADDATSGSHAASKKAENADLPSPPNVQSSACIPVCEPGWQACAGRCDGQPEACIRSCEVEFRTCASACN